MGLEYLYKYGERPCSKSPLKVKLEGKHVGAIRKVKDGYQYYSNGEKTGGAVYAKISEVQNSLLPTRPVKKDRAPAKREMNDALIEDLERARKKIDKLFIDFSNWMRKQRE